MTPQDEAFFEIGAHFPAGDHGDVYDDFNVFQHVPLPFEQFPNPHLNDCPDKSIRLDRCAYCCQSDYPAELVPFPPAPAGPSNSYTLQEQRMYRSPSKSYAQAVGAPSSQGPTAAQYSRTTSTYFPNHVQQPESVRQQVVNPAFYTMSPLMDTNGSTWAKIANDPRQAPVQQYEVLLPRNSSFMEAQAHLLRAEQQAGFREISRRAPTRSIRKQSLQSSYFPAEQTQPSHGHQNLLRPTYWSNSPAGSPSQTQSGFPLVQPTSHPGDVANLVQQTTFGGHRGPFPPSQMASSPLIPSSPASPSVASSQRSKASVRRKGEKMRDPTDPRYQFECPECHCRFSKNEDLRRHVNRTHIEVAGRPHKCPYRNCKWAFINPKDVKRHLTTHSPRQHFTCPYHPCEKTYTRDDNLQRHIKQEHLDPSDDSAYVSMSRTTSSRTDLSQPYFR